MAEGGRLVLPEPARALVDAGWEVEPGPGLSLRTDEADVWLYSAYGLASPTHLTWTKDGCDPMQVPVTVRPLEWTLLADWDPEIGGPPAREYGAWWLSDPPDGESAPPALYVFGGFHYVPRQFTPASDLWRFDFGSDRWTELAAEGAPLAPGARAARGPTAGTVLLHGGAQIRDDGSLDTPPLLAEVDHGDAGPVWRTAPNAEGAPGSYTGAFVRDARRDRWLSICGVDTRRLGIHCAVSEYRPETGWRQVPVTGPLPPGRYGFHYAYDEETDRVFVVAGQYGAGNLDIVGDTWALELGEDPPRWVRLFEDAPEVRRRNGAYVLDPVGRRLLLWGGTADGRTPLPGLSALRLDRGEERWDHVDVPASVPARASGMGAYDAARGRALFGFGNGAAVYTDLYALSL